MSKKKYWKKEYEWQRAKIKINRIFIKNYKKNKSCAVCGYNEHPEILEFHHVNPKDKFKVVNYLQNHPYNLKVITDEINKCVLLCPNCHHWLSYQEQSIKGE